MTDLNVELKLDRIRCHDEGDGPGNAEPYLWTVFFKVDGDTVVVNSDDLGNIFLQGPPTVVTTPGNHGNLGTSDVDEGDTINVPAIIGEYRTILKPIPLTVPVLGRTEVGGIIGCIVVLMEEDNTSDSDAARGHERLDSAVRDQLTSLLGTLGITKPEPTEEDISAMSDRIGSAVKSAIQDGVGVVEWLVGFGNMDDQVGSAVFRFSHSTLEQSGGAPIPFGRRWKREGDWELFGHIRATPIRRVDSKCCEEMRRRTRELERMLSEHEKRLSKIEAGLATRAKGDAPTTIRSKANAKLTTRA